MSLQIKVGKYYLTLIRLMKCKAFKKQTHHIQQASVNIIKNYSSVKSTFHLKHLFCVIFSAFLPGILWNDHENLMRSIMPLFPSVQFNHRNFSSRVTLLEFFFMWHQKQQRKQGIRVCGERFETQTNIPTHDN